MIRPGDVVAGLDYAGWRKLPEGVVVITVVDGEAVGVEPEPDEETA